MGHPTPRPAAVWGAPTPAPGRGNIARRIAHRAALNRAHRAQRHRAHPHPQVVDDINFIQCVTV